MRHAKLLAAGLVVAASVLSACGNDPSVGSGKQLVGAAKSIFSPHRKAAPPAEITREELRAAGVPLLLVKVPKLGTRGYLGVYGTNRDVVTWSTADHSTVSLRNGLITATRGLPGDLMSASLPTVADIRAGSGAVARTHYYLDGLDQTVPTVFRCIIADAGPADIVVAQLAYKTRHDTETCTGGNGTFTNDYWFDSKNVLRQSRQWVGPLTGYLEIENLVE
jgi:hypothetical protein